jgi:predicted nucleotide-binding protein
MMAYLVMDEESDMVEATQKEAASKPDKSAGKAKVVKVSQADLPTATLVTAVKVAQGLQDQFAGSGAAPHDVALAIDVSPTSSAWRALSGAAAAYGLTNGAYNSQQIVLTDLGRRIVSPLEEGDDDQARVEASLKPRVLRDFFIKYDRGKFPRDDIAKNVLANLGVPADRLQRALEILKENGRATGIIRDTKTGPFVALESSTASGRVVAADPGSNARMDDDEGDEDGFEAVAATGAEMINTPRAVPATPVNKQIFVAHGKNHAPLEELKKILDQFKIPYKVAVDEPNVGRPISRKVAQLMRECSAGIFIFTGDEKFLTTDGAEIFRPSENVVYELGAASVLWENKIIILKQRDVTFPSDYKDLGYIEFDQNTLATKRSIC